MTSRLLHLLRTEARSHRWALSGWVVFLLVVAACVFAKDSIEKTFEVADLYQMRDSRVLISSRLFTFLIAADPWLWFLAGLLSAWIVLADPLQSATAFWVTRPVRLGELLRARALVCLGVFVLLPALLLPVALLPNHFSAHDLLLGILSFMLAKSGMVPLGFAVGALWPRVGRRWAALLPLAGWWLGLSVWSWFNKGRTDYEDHSLAFIVAWLLTLAVLPLILWGRRSLWPQWVMGLLAFALPWLTSPLMLWQKSVPQTSAPTAELAAVQLSARPHDFHLTEKQDVAFEFDVKAAGLLSGMAAEIRSATFSFELQPGGKRVTADWVQKVFLMSSYYAAEAQVMRVPLENFPPQYRWEDYYPAVVLPKAAFASWDSGQMIQITGKVRLRLHQFQKRWQGLYQEKWQLRSGGLLLHQAPGLITKDAGQVVWLRPWLAQAVARADTSEVGMLFHPERTRWCPVFQPPVKLGPDKFSRDMRRTPALWAGWGEQNMMFTNYFDWTTHTDFESNWRNIDDVPELHEIWHNNAGLTGLPFVMLMRTAVTEIELPLMPLLVTKQEILETKKITPDKP